MKYEVDRAGDRAGEPSLAEMTEKAIKILQKNPKGYFLLVEGNDKASYALSSYLYNISVPWLHNIIEKTDRSQEEHLFSSIFRATSHVPNGL